MLGITQMANETEHRLAEQYDLGVPTLPFDAPLPGRGLAYRRPWQLDSWDWMHAHYSDPPDGLGWSQEQIANHLECSTSTVNNALRRLGIKPRPRGHPLPPEIEALLGNYEWCAEHDRLGTRHEVLAEQLGCSRTVVSERFRGFGFYRRHTKARERAEIAKHEQMIAAAAQARAERRDARREDRQELVAALGPSPSETAIITELLRESRAHFEPSSEAWQAALRETFQNLSCVPEWLEELEPAFRACYQNPGSRHMGVKPDHVDGHDSGSYTGMTIIR